MSLSQNLQKQYCTLDNKNKNIKKTTQNNLSLSKLLKKYFLLSLVLTLLLVTKPTFAQNELAKNLEREFNRIATSFPENWENYFFQITSTGQIKIDKFNLKDFEHRLRKVHRFIDDIITKFTSIIYADYVTFKTFSFSVSSYYSGYQEFVGAARIINDWVEIAYIEINSSSWLRPIYNQIPSRRCWKVFFFFEKCEDYIQHVERGYTIEELQLLLDTMKAHSYQHLMTTTKNVLSALQTKEFVISMNSPYYSDDGAYFVLMQEDGNLVIYQRGVQWRDMNDKPIWSSHTYHFGQQPYLLVIEKDGELVIYDSLWVPLFRAATASKGVAPRRLVVTNDGELQLVDALNEVLWKTYRDIE